MRAGARAGRRLAGVVTAGALAVTLLGAPGAAAERGSTSPDGGVDLSLDGGQIGAATTLAHRGSTPRRAARASGDSLVGRQATLRRTTEGSAPPSSQQQLAQVHVHQDLSAGRLTVQAGFAATPAAAQQSAVEVYLGTWAGDTCQMDAAVLASGFEVQQGEDSAGQFADGTALGVQRSRSGATVTIRSTDQEARIRAAAWECAFARLRSADGGTPYQGLYAESLEEVHAPQLRIDPGDPIQGNYAGKWTRLRLEVYNSSRSDAPDVRLRATGKGIQIRKPSRSLGMIEDRSTKYGITYQVRLRGAKARPLTLRVSTGGRTFTEKVTIARKPRPTRYASLAHRYFWGHSSDGSSTGWELRAVWFLDNRWAYLGFPPNGKRPRCVKASKLCKRYTYQRGSGQVRMAGKRFKVTSEGFDRAGGSHYPTTLARKGQRFDVQLMRHDNSGSCGGLSCTAWTEWLSMSRNGRFVLSSQTISSIGVPGVGTIWAGVPPDQKGTYRVVAPGRVELRFASGKRERHLLAVQHDVRNRPNPAGAGVVLGDRNFYLG